MTTLPPARIAWATSIVIELVERAIREGWCRERVLVEAAPPVDEADLSRTTQLDPLRVLGLSEQQLEALWLLACCDVEPKLALIAHALGAGDRPELSVAVWQRLVVLATGKALSSADLDALIERGLIESTRDPRLPAHRRWIRAHDRVVELACGEVRLERDVAELAELVEPPDDRGARGTPDEAIRAGALVICTGPDLHEGANQATRLAARGGFATLRVRCAELATEPDKLSRQLAGIFREAALLEALAMFEGLELLGESARATLGRELRRVARPVLGTASVELPWALDRAVFVQRIAAPSVDERKRLWREALSAAPNDLIDAVAVSYQIGSGAIRGAAATLRTSRDVPDAGSVHDALRTHLDRRLGSLARRIETTQTWSDLVLPRDQLEQLVELVARVRHRSTVLDAWGFGAKVGRGVGTAVLLSGPPGTGKTMVAGLVARELGLDLYQVDLSRVVSKYIGETEKNLATIFDAAESGHAVILFDEADSMFAKRSEVKSSNDRYANLEVNYLLQRIEQFAGISLLTTNHEATLDEALRRRIAIHVRFPVPDEDHREQLWRAMLPSDAPLSADIDFPALARFAMTGGYIKNAALRAAYLAASTGTAITPALLLRSARAEYEAMGKIVSGL